MYNNFGLILVSTDNSLQLTYQHQTDGMIMGEMMGRHDQK